MVWIESQQKQQWRENQPTANTKNPRKQPREYSKGQQKDQVTEFYGAPCSFPRTLAKKVLRKN